MDIRDRVALVTGAGAGAGRAIAARLAAEGAAVVVADIDPDGGRETVRRLEAAGGRAALVRADVTVEPDVRAMVAFAGSTFGGLDVLVNNAGGGWERPYFPEAPTDRWSRVLDLNLRGPMMAIQHALPAMDARGGGAIVNVASVAGLGTLRNELCEYAAAKAGLIRLTATLASLAERRSIRVNCVVPDWIWSEAVAAHVASLPPAERLVEPDELTPPEDIAGAVASLVADDSLAGRVLVCWCGHPWALVAPGDPGYGRSEVMPAPQRAPAASPGS